jgi:hypothetical protein
MHSRLARGVDSWEQEAGGSLEGVGLVSEWQCTELGVLWSSEYNRYDSTSTSASDHARSPWQAFEVSGDLIWTSIMGMIRKEKRRYNSSYRCLGNLPISHLPWTEEDGISKQWTREQSEKAESFEVLLQPWICSKFSKQTKIDWLVVKYVVKK